MPFNFSSRNLSSLHSKSHGGEWGGEAGMLVLATGGRVRSWIRARSDVNGDDERESGYGMGDGSSKDGSLGPGAGPSCGPNGVSESGSTGCVSWFTLVVLKSSSIVPDPREVSFSIQVSKTD